jgi:hypothetical protein
LSGKSFDQAGNEEKEEQGPQVKLAGGRGGSEVRKSEKEKRSKKNKKRRTPSCFVPFPPSSIPVRLHDGGAKVLRLTTRSNTLRYFKDLKIE